MLSVIADCHRQSMIVYHFKCVCLQKATTSHHIATHPHQALIVQCNTKTVLK